MQLGDTFISKTVVYSTKGVRHPVGTRFKYLAKINNITDMETLIFVPCDSDGTDTVLLTREDHQRLFGGNSENQEQKKE